MISLRSVSTILVILVLGIVLFKCQSPDQANVTLTEANIMDAISLASSVKRKVNEYYSQNKLLPANNSEVGLPDPSDIFSDSVKSIEIRNGFVMVRMSDKFVHGGEFELQPQQVPFKPSTLEWSCVSDEIAQEYFANVHPSCLYTPSGAIKELFNGIHRRDIELVKQSLDKGIDPNQIWYGDTPLMMAIDRSTVAVVKTLIESGADVNQGSPYHNGLSLITFAVKENRMKIVKVLLNNGVNIDAPDEAGNIPLVLAIKQNNLKVVKLLVQNGANVNIKGKDGYRPIQYAYSRNSKEILRYLQDNLADQN